MGAASALIISQDPATTAVATETAHRLGLDIVVVEKLDQAVQRFEHAAPVVVIIDLSRAEGPAHRLPDRFTQDGGRRVIALVEPADLRTAVDAMRAGVAYVLDKRATVKEMEQAVRVILPRPSGSRFRDVFGGSRKMEALLEVVTRLAAGSTPVLIRGESGVGKRIVARALHHLSDRSDQPLIERSCVALPADRLERDLEGAVAAAQDGTLFLDEIGEASPRAQALLLGVLTADMPRTRLIASTTANMYRLVAGGLFRADLYERLAIATIDVPPLRERREEIDSLVRYFLERFAKEFQRSVPAISPSMADLLRAYDWPGNVRELENIVKRWVVLGGEDQVRAEIEGRRAVAERRPPVRTGARLTLRDIARRAARDAERIVLQDALLRARGNRAAVARELRVSYKTLLQKLAEAGLAPKPRTNRAG